MPTYDYECGACGLVFEEFQGINDATLKKCPKCKKLKLRRLIGKGGAVLFKGAGFYSTDYRSESYKSAAKSDTKPAETPAACTGTPSSCDVKGCGPTKSESK